MREDEGRVGVIITMACIYRSMHIRSLGVRGSECPSSSCCSLLRWALRFSTGRRLAFGHGGGRMRALSQEEKSLIPIRYRCGPRRSSQDNLDAGEEDSAVRSSLEFSSESKTSEKKIPTWQIFSLIKKHLQYRFDDPAHIGINFEKTMATSHT